ncbi:hypothetical protein [Methanosarcina acetivorans]|uniref:hypothetical protein n=1 Tax=Methanosarcina acetivorans TaxID=2214 RepID=UPI001D04C357|nr:hypothetical protein [Methanosarcina acetivorans]
MDRNPYSSIRKNLISVRVNPNFDADYSETFAVNVPMPLSPDSDRCTIKGGATGRG